MNDEEKDLIRESWRAAKPLGEEAARLFYERLFTISPSTRRAFDDVDMPAQHHRLLAALDFVVGHLDRPGMLLPRLRELGERHAAYGVRPTDYEAVGAALLWTLAQGLGERFDESTKAAWTKAYALIDSVMRPLSCAGERAPRVAAASGSEA